MARNTGDFDIFRLIHEEIFSCIKARAILYIDQNLKFPKEVWPSPGFSRKMDEIVEKLTRIPFCVDSYGEISILQWSQGSL